MRPEVPYPSILRFPHTMTSGILVKRHLALVFLLCAVCCNLATAQNQRIDGVVQRADGTGASGALIAVCSQPANTGVTPCTPAAPVCLTLTDVICNQANPVVADQFGNYHFYVLAATCRTFQFSGAGLTTIALTDQACGGGGGGGGGPTTSTFSIPLEHCAPDMTGNSFPSVLALTNWFDDHWEFVHGAASFITCMVRIPQTVAVTPNASIILELAVNDATAGHTANFQTCDITIGASATINVGGLSCAGNQAFTTTATAFQRVTLTYAVQSTVAANNILVVKISTTTTGTQPVANMLLWGYLKIDQTQ